MPTRPDADLSRLRSKVRVTTAGGSNTDLGSIERPLTSFYLKVASGQPGVYRFTVDDAGTLTGVKVR